jgi:hypothetical protein
VGRRKRARESGGAEPARGHAAYEYNVPQLEEPEWFSFKPMSGLEERLSVRHWKAQVGQV